MVMVLLIAVLIITLKAVVMVVVVVSCTLFIPPREFAVYIGKAESSIT
jgi:hypothetical protein